MRVRVVEAGKNGAALRIDHDGLRPTKPVHFSRRAHVQDLVALHRHRFCHRPIAIGGVDAPVHHDQINRPIVGSLSANDQTGDERDRDDERDDVSRDAGGHGRGFYSRAICYAFAFVCG
jgi:hypothetical protein